jgi:transcriptional regulator GlxA family with amidase domain
VKAILVARHPRPVRVANGVWMRPEASFGRCPAPDIVYVPELFVPPDDPSGDRFKFERRWLRQCHAQGATIAAACSGTLMIAENDAHPSPVTEMVELSRLPERTFKRRFKKATGLSPLDYAHSIRLEEAKQMLETTDTPIERIAVDVGYQDDSFFRRLFRRRVGLTPRAYRQRVQSFRDVLVEAENGGS